MKTALLSLALSLPVAAARAQAPPALDPRLADVPELADLPARWTRALADLGVPGCAVAVVRGDAVLGYATLGVRNPAGDPVDLDTIFYIASITKTYTAAALAALAEDGVLDLDQVVEEYLPRFTLADEQAAWHVTVRDLLCHRPGLESFPIVFLDAYTGEITEDRYYHWLAQVEPLDEVTYSNVHFTLAGRVLEAQSGRCWQDALAERLFVPAGLTRTTAYASRMYGDANAAIPMKVAGAGFAACSTRKTDATMHAAGGMGTSARDGARWLLLQLGEGQLGGTRVFSAETARALIARQSDSEPQGQIRRLDGFGLGWMLGTYRGRPYATHGGGYVGTAAHMSFLPEERLGVVVLANSSPGGQALCDVVSIDVYDRLLGIEERDLLPSYVEDMREIRGERTPPESDLASSGALSLPAAAYAGRYLDPHWGTLRLEFAEGEFSAALGELALRLHGRGTDAFAAAADDQPELAGRFVLDGERVVAVELGGDGLAARFERLAE